MNSNRKIRVSKDNATVEFQYDDNITWAELQRLVCDKFSKRAVIGLFFRNMRIQGFRNYAMRALLSIFSSLHLIVDPHQFKDMAIQARNVIRDQLCPKSRTTAVPVMIEYHFNNQFMSEKYVLSNDSRISVLTSMCGRHVPHSCVAVENLCVPLRKFNGTDKLEIMLPYVEDDGFLHVYASDTHRFDFEDYLLGEVEYYDQALYRKVQIKGSFGKNKCFLVKKSVKMRQLEVYLRDNYEFEVVPEDEAFPLISDLDEEDQHIVLVETRRKIMPIQPSLQYTCAIGYREPLLYLLRKSNILIVYDILQGFVQTHQLLPTKQSLTAYQQRLPAMLQHSFLMYEILKSGVYVMEFSLKGKLLREMKYGWDSKYKYQLVCLDYVTVKVGPEMTRNEIWKVHEPDNRLVFSAEKDSKVFISKVGHSYTSNLDLIAVYHPSNLAISIYQFTTKNLKYKIRAGTYLNWLSFSLCGEYILYSNDFAPIEECQLKTGMMTPKPRMCNSAAHFYDQNRKVMTIREQRLWVEGAKTGIPVSMAIVIAGRAMCRVSDSDHINKAIFL